MKYYVYRHYDSEGNLLYVGCTQSLEFRTKTHKASSPWKAEIARIAAEEYPTREDALFAERTAICNELPRCNGTMRSLLIHKTRNDTIRELAKQGVSRRLIGKAVGITGAAVCGRIKSYRLEG